MNTSTRDAVVSCFEFLHNSRGPSNNALALKSNHILQERFEVLYWLLQNWITAVSVSLNGFSLTSSIANYSGTWQKVASLGMCWKHGQSCAHWYDAILLTFSARIATIHLRCSTSYHFKSVQFYRLHFTNHTRSFVIPRDSFKPDLTGRYATLVALGSFLCATKAYSNTFLLKFVTTASWLRVYFHSSYFDTNFVVVNCFCGNFGAVSSWSDDHCEGLLACHTMCSIL